MEIIENKALLLTTKDHTRVTTVIPKSRLVETNGVAGRVLVHWGLDEAQVLRNLGFKNVPSPILGNYAWPGMFKPYEHQITTAAFLTMNKRAYCFSDPGTGKTAAIAWAADYLLIHKKIQRVLIICPLSIMSSAWQGDLFKTLMHRRVDIAHGSQERRVKIITSDAEFVVINFDGVESVAKELKAAKFDLVIIDEANALKTHTTNRWAAINSILYVDTWVWMLTGTPASQSPIDAYGLARMLIPSSVPRYFGAFRDKVMYKITQFKWVSKPTAKDTVFATLQPAIRFAKEDCLDLPELVYTSRMVELTAQQRKYYNILRKQFVMEAAGTPVTSVNVAVNINKLLQISCGAVYTDDKEVVEFDIKNRYKVLLEAINESTHKVLVFVPFRHAIDILYDRLRADNYEVEVIHGGVSANSRTDIFARFQNTPNPRILIIQPAAASHGVTLHAANTVVWWGPVTSYETYAQANARVHRAGQKNPCLVVKLIGSQVEENLYKTLDSREENMGGLMALYKEELQD